MSKPLTLGSLLLLSSALFAPAAIAQSATPPPQPVSPPTAADDEIEDDPAVPDDDEGGDPARDDEEVDVSTPGADAPAPIVVTGRYIPNEVRVTPQVINVLSTEDIARTGEGDIAGALERVTGLSVVGDGFVYVRGLGDRYSLALLNGLAIPSPQPLKRVVPLDIFPTSIIASALVQKSYSPNYPGEFGGGVINLTTPAIPDESFVSIGGSVGGNSETTGHLGYTYFGSDTDWTGFDDGSRDIPPVFRDALGSGNLINAGANFSVEEIKAITTSLANASTTLLQRNDNVPANFGANISAGDAWDIGNSLFGVIFNAGYSNSWRTRDALQQEGVGDSLNSSFQSVLTENRILANALLGFGAEFAEHELRFTNIFIRDTLKQGQVEAGFDADTADFDPDLPPQLLNQRTAWFERQLFNTQLVGEFVFGDLAFDLRGGYANSQRESPYERTFSYAYSTEVDDYVNSLTRSGETATVSFSDLNEDVYNAGADLSYTIPSLPEVTVGAGYAFLDTHRESTRRDFVYRPRETLPLGVIQLRPDYLLSDVTIELYDILLVESSALAGAAAYEGDLQVHAGYGQVIADITPNIRISGGVRYEDAEQSVTILDLFAQGGIDQTPPLENQYWLPAATLTWNFAPDMQLRLHGSKTIARPQFRELAPQIYLDPESDRIFVGNPFLNDSELWNAEARFEWYFGRDQNLSVAGFFKRIENPIEAVSTFTTGLTTQTTFANAPEADLYGAEIELQKYFPLHGLGWDWFDTRRAVVIANYTYSQSDLKVVEGDEIILDDRRGLRPALEVFTDGDRLTGQSEHIANLQIGIEDTERLSQATFLLSYASERITAQGPILQGIRVADVVEDPGLRLDFVAREAVDFLGDETELKFEVRNITGEDYSERRTNDERTIIINEYDVGISISLGIGIRF
ncbi:MAG: TonB-dependent receptor domain-containing protein [Sphingomonadaceae bacterium]